MNHTDQLKTLDFSKLHRYSLGIVVEDNIDNLKTIKIYPLEKLFNKGKDLFKEDKIDLKIKTKSIKIDEKSKEVIYEYGDERLVIDTTKYIIANWLNRNNTNRITAPNVCKGEKVIIYKYSNNDEYYWETEETDLSLRKEDHVVYTYSDKPNLDETEDEIEDRYSIIFSPKNKMLRIHTTDKYGEYTTYDINLKTFDGYFELIDGKGNFVKLDSATDTLITHIEGSKNQYDHVINGDEGYVELNDDKGNSIKLDSPSDTLTTNINKNIIANTQRFEINTIDYIVNTTNYNITTSEYKLNSTNNMINSSITEYSSGQIIKQGGIDLSMTHNHIGNLGFPTSVPNDV